MISNVVVHRNDISVSLLKLWVFLHPKLFLQRVGYVAIHVWPCEFVQINKTTRLACLVVLKDSFLCIDALRPVCAEPEFAAVG